MSYISNKTENDGILEFTLHNVNVSYANAIRRTVLTDIETVGLKTEPDDKNEMKIFKNSTKLNNEIIKHRMACIPIHISDTTIDVQSLIIEINVSNTTDTIIPVTTNDIKIKDAKTKLYMDDNEVKSIFPLDDITNDPIIITKLYPGVEQVSQSESLHLECPMSLCTARDSGVYNVVSTCSYGFTEDPVKQKTAWEAYKKDHIDNNDDKSIDVEMEKENWKLLQGRRCTVRNSFDFVVETLGVFDNVSIIRKACQVLVNKYELLRNEFEQDNIEIKKGNTVRDSYDIIIPNDNNTLGKLLEFSLYDLYYEKQPFLSYVGFNKPHPHVPYSIIRIMFHNDDNTIDNIKGIVIPSIQSIISIFQSIQKEI